MPRPRQKAKLFHVEVVTKARCVDSPSRGSKNQGGSGSQWEYYVKWAGYDSDENSWEPASGLVQCQRLLESFQDHVGIDGDDEYQPGYEVSAKEDWIKEEKAYFRRTYQTISHRKKNTKSTGEKATATKKLSTAKSSINTVIVHDVEEDPDNGRPRNLKRKLIQINESSDESTPDSDSEQNSEEQEHNVPPRVTVPTPPLPVVKSTFRLPPGSSTPTNQDPNVSLGQAVLGSILPTKQRLAIGALDAQPPKAMPPSKSKSTLLLARSSPLMPLSFKKKTVPTPVLVPTGSSYANDAPLLRGDEPTLAMINAPPSPGRDGHDIEIQHQQTTTPLSPSTEVNAFLHEIMPPSIAAPLRPAIECPFEPQPPRNLLPKHIPSQKPEKTPWAWSGDVFIGAETSKPAFGVTIRDVTAHIDGALRFSVALPSTGSLRFSAFYDAVDIDAILAACRGVDQFARVCPRNNVDAEPLETLSLYMARMRKIVSLPVHLDNLVAGHILLLHRTSHPVTSQLSSFQEIQNDGGLVTVLLSWSLTAKEIMKYCHHVPRTPTPLPTDITPRPKEEGQWKETTKSWYHYYALRVLKFPASLLSYLSEEGQVRPVCLWYEDSDKAAGVESMTLMKVLKKLGTRPVHISGAPRLLFIHVGAIRSLHKLPGLVDFCNSSVVQFYKYGTHETVPPQSWGVGEIYPCGGIVTFTPQALIDDPIGAAQRISQISSHPMWACYIIHSALGMVAQIQSQRRQSDPIEDLENGKFQYAKLLNMIEDGELSLLSSPSMYDLSLRNDHDPWQEWVKKHWTHRPHGPRAILQTCIDTFKNKYGALSPTEWTTAILNEISTDVKGIRSQPVFMRTYRRYIIVDSPKSQTKHHDALEWTTAKKLDFRDDFFPSQ